MSQTEDFVSNQIGNDAETGATLDQLLAEAQTPQNSTPEVTLPTEAEVAPDTETLPETLAEEPATTRVPETTPAPVVAEETDPTLKAFDEVKLRADASIKTKDTFANLKKISTEAVRAERAEKIQLRKELDELRSKPAAPSNELSDDVKTELENLRKFKAEFDIENDPEFKKQIEARVEPRKASNYDAIYAVLRAHSLPESEVKALKELSESDRVSSIGDFVAELPRISKMKIEAKLLDNLNLDDERQRAITEARDKAATNRAQFREAPEKIREQSQVELKQAAEQFRSHDVFKKAEILATVPPEDRKRIEASNAHADKLNKLYDEVINDATPKGRAEAAFGLVLAHHFKAQLDAVTAEKTKLATEISEIKKRGSTANVGRVVNVPSTTRPSITNLDAGSSLDALAREAGLV